MNFVLSGKPVLLEQPRKGAQKLITHVLMNHAGTVFLRDTVVGSVYVCVRNIRFTLNEAILAKEHYLPCMKKSNSLLNTFYTYLMSDTAKNNFDLVWKKNQIEC